MFAVTQSRLRSSGFLRRWVAWLGWIGMVAGGGGPVRAQEAPAVITTASDFWNLYGAERDQPHPVDVELIVYFYDAEWKLLYGEFGGLPSYMPVQGQPLLIRAGQQVRLEGTVVPSAGFDGATIKSRLLAENQLPAPQSTAGRIQELAQLNGRWVEVEGYVLSQREADATHVELKVWTEGQMMLLVFQIGGTDPVPQLEGALIRARGVYDAAADAAGKMQQLQLWVPQGENVVRIGSLADDRRFMLPVTPIEALASAGENWVRIMGRVQEAHGGELLTVRDETGQVEIATAQPGMPPVGSRVEVIGRPNPAEIGWTLRTALFRRVAENGGAAPSPGPVAPVRLRLTDQVVQLAPDEAAKGYPVALAGVVTWADARVGFFYLQDISGGIKVRSEPAKLPTVGSNVLVTGHSIAGSVSPEVEAKEVAASGVMPLPPPRRVSLEQAMTGAEEGRWVEMQGFVRQVVAAGDWQQIELTSATGEFTATLPPEVELVPLAGAWVRIRGVCTMRSETGRELPEVRLWVQNNEAVSVLASAPADPFALAPTTIAELALANAAQSNNRRVRLSGTVLLHEAGRFLYLDDGTGGVFVLSREKGELQPGETIDLVGLTGRSGSRMLLREGRWRPVGKAGAKIVPFLLGNLAELRTEMDARLVSVRATLRQAVVDGGQARLTLQADGTIFDGLLHDATGWVPPAAGSSLELAGVYVLEFDEYRQPHAFRLELRTAADIRLLDTPPWWTARRVWTIAAILALAVCLGLAWALVLRRRVQQQTEQIRRQLEKEARLQTELERSSRLESLGVLAGGIAHDFNNLLTAILGNLGLAALDKRVMAAAGDCITEAERGARRARDITQQLLTFAKGGDPVRSMVPLPEIVTEAANFARHGSNIRFDYDFPHDLPPGNVDAGQISRVVHNLVINAVQAMPEGGVVKIALAGVMIGPGEHEPLRPGHYLQLTIVDTGRGIPAENLTRIFDPYFSTKGKQGNSGLGLATVRSIIKKHDGHIEVESRVGHGTTCRIWLPAAEGEVASVPVSVLPPAGKGPARILVMDDEEVIRSVAGRMLTLAGHETGFANEGAEAIRVYMAARQAGHPYDLVIFDLTVPGGMGGREAMEALVKFHPEIRGIASSGYSNDPVMADPRRFGFRTSLPKPYDISDLTRAVEEARRH